jgi:hypothetical protein
MNKFKSFVALAGLCVATLGGSAQAQSKPEGVEVEILNVKTWAGGSIDITFSDHAVCPNNPAGPWASLTPDMAGAEQVLSVALAAKLSGRKVRVGTLKAANPSRCTIAWLQLIE